jgi:hypothetical protein
VELVTKWFQGRPVRQKADNIKMKITDFWSVAWGSLVDNSVCTETY